MNKLWRFGVIVARSPLIWGGLVTVGFYAFIHHRPLFGDFTSRYLASHPVEYIATAMFFVGIAALVMKALDLAEQLMAVDRKVLGPTAEVRDPKTAADLLLGRLEGLPPHRRRDYVTARLRGALEFITRQGTSDGLNDELKDLAEADHGRAHDGYGLVRLIIWCIPILGFLGTVIGITGAIANLTPESLNNPTEVSGALGVAFDTTALALALSIPLMFGKFFVERVEARLLGEVDRAVAEQMAGHFDDRGHSDPQSLAVRRIAETMIRATEQSIERHAELWQSALDESNRRWSEVIDSGRRQLETALSEAVARGVEDHAQRLLAAEIELVEQRRQHLDDLVGALVETGKAAREQQSELSYQSALLAQVLTATDHIANLETRLNDNLSALARAQHFEETLLTLSGALNLLNVRLGQEADSGPRVALSRRAPSADHAA